MNLNIFFFTITIKKRELSLEEATHEEMVKLLYEENKDRLISRFNLM